MPRPDSLMPSPIAEPAFAAPTVRRGVVVTMLGPMILEASERGIRRLEWIDETADSHAVPDDPSLAPLLRRAREAIDGGLDDGLPLDLRGTAFQLRVWNALREIPSGSTRSYGDLARRLGLPPGSARAVGAACGANRVAVLVPCHRVGRADGSLAGFRWGLDRKRALLDRERSRDRSVPRETIQS